VIYIYLSIMNRYVNIIYIILHFIIFNIANSPQAIFHEQSLFSRQMLYRKINVRAIIYKAVNMSTLLV